MPIPIRKAVIPAAGLGTRFLPATKAIPKEMLPLVDKPAIQYVVEEAAAAGITDILIVTGRSKGAIEDHFDRSPDLEAALRSGGKESEADRLEAIHDLACVHYVRQAEPRGLGHAVGMARQHVGDEPFVVMLPDDLMHPRSGILTGMLDAYQQHSSAVLALKRVTGREISIYGVAAAKTLDAKTVEVLDLVEKPTPEEAPSDLGVMGRYVLTPQIFEAIDRTEPGRGGELQLTDAIRNLIGKEKVVGYVIGDGRFDTGNKLDFLIASITFALERDDVAPDLIRFLRTAVQSL